MRKASIALGLALLALTATASAKIVTFEYTANIDRLQVRDLWNGGTWYADETDWPGFTVRKGETITGRISYDTDIPLQHTQSSAVFNAYVSNDTAAFTHAVTLLGSGKSASVNENLEMALLDSTNSRDKLTFSGAARPDNYYSWEIGFSSSALRPGFQGSVLPGERELSGFAGDSLNILFWAGVGYVTADASITSFNVVSSVPEPSTYAMLLVGAVPLLVRRRKAQA